jgi:hypothetical protein
MESSLFSLGDLLEYSWKRPTVIQYIEPALPGAAAGRGAAGAAALARLLAAPAA